MKRLALDKIKQQPYFKTGRERWGVTERATYWASSELLNHLRPLKWFGNWKHKVRRQPFFGVQLRMANGGTVTFRRTAADTFLDTPRGR